MTKRQRVGIAMFTALAICLAACERSPRTFIEVSVDGVEYRIASGTLFLFDHPNGETFFDLGPDIRRANLVTGVPNVGIQWRMPLGEPSELVGRSIDLSDPSLHGLSTFRFSEDVAVVSLERPQRVTVDIDRVERSVVEGRFRAERFVPVESEDEPASPVHIEGRFRAVIDRR